VSEDYPSRIVAPSGNITHRGNCLVKTSRFVKFILSDLGDRLSVSIFGITKSL
jgi:hypothetical protein